MAIEKVVPSRILILDDEPSIRQVLEFYFIKEGYEVVVTSSGEGALEACKDALEKGRPFDAAIIDLVIPGSKSGSEIAEEINRIVPDIKTIAVSGNAHNPVFAHPRAHGFSYAIVKPFKLNEVVAAIQQVIVKKTTLGSTSTN